MSPDTTPAMVAAPFDDIEQQRDAATLGMWTFLATEVLLFGGLFLSYTVYRLTYPAAFAEASRHTDFWLGTINTAVLLCSSLTMAMGVHSAQEGRRWPLIGFLFCTLLLGVAFMGIKGYEYYDDYHKHLVPGVNFALPGAEAPHAALFFVLYFFMTGLHAIHLTIGIGIVTVMIFLSLRGRFSGGRYIPIELTGLYWHLVDIVWVFLYPLLYLIGRHG